MHILHTVLYTFPKVLTDEESLFTDQKRLLLVIISFILLTFQGMKLQLRRQTVTSHKQALFSGGENLKETLLV